MKVGMIGLGGMGKPIAECVLRAGFELTVADLREEPVEALASLGAAAAGTPREVASASDLVLASLPSNEASERVALGADGVLEGAKPGDVYIDTSTISPKVVTSIARRFSPRGVEVLDAPVSGGMRQRKEGALTVMVGGEASTVARATPVLEAFGGRIIHVGGVGTGAAAKLVNNLTMATNSVAAMEALALGVKAGLDVEKLRDVISTSSGASQSFDFLSELILTESAEPAPGALASRSMRTVIKDVKLATDLAKELSVPLFHGSATAQAWTAGEARGMSEREYWGLMEYFEELAGVRVRPPGL